MGIDGASCGMHGGMAHGGKCGLMDAVQLVRRAGLQVAAGLRGVDAQDANWRSERLVAVKVAGRTV